MQIGPPGGRQTHCSLIDHSTSANNMHEIKMMVVYSTSTRNVIVYRPSLQPLKLHENKGGVEFSSGTMYIKWSNLCITLIANRKQHRSCQEETSVTSERTSGVKKIVHQSLSYWLNLSIDLYFDYSKCYLLGRLHMTNTTGCK